MLLGDVLQRMGLLDSGGHGLGLSLLKHLQALLLR